MLVTISIHHNTLDFKTNIVERLFHHKVRFMPPIQYSVQQLINFSATQKEIHSETANSKTLQ